MILALDLARPVVAHSVISLRCGIWSLPGHSGHRANHINQARFMSTRPSLTCQWHCAVRIRLARGMGLSTDCLRDEIGRPTPHQRRDETPATGTCDLKVGGRSLISWDRYSDSSAVLHAYWVPSDPHPRHQSWEGTGTSNSPCSTDCTDTFLSGSGCMDND